MSFMENLMIMQSSKDCAHCPQFPWCSMLPDECDMEPISEDELPEPPAAEYTEDF